MIIGFKIGTVGVCCEANENLLNHPVLIDHLTQLYNNLQDRISNKDIKGQYVIPLLLTENKRLLIYIDTDKYTSPFFLEMTNPGQQISKTLYFKDILILEDERVFLYMQSSLFSINCLKYANKVVSEKTLEEIKELIAKTNSNIERSDEGEILL